MARQTKKRSLSGTRINNMHRNRHNRTRQSNNNKGKVTRTGKRSVMTGGFKGPKVEETKPEETKPTSPLERFQKAGQNVILGLPQVNRRTKPNFSELPKPGAVNIAKLAFMDAAAKAAASRASPSLPANPLPPEFVSKFVGLHVNTSGSLSNPTYGTYGAETGNPVIKASNPSSQYTNMSSWPNILTSQTNPDGNPTASNQKPAYMEVGEPVPHVYETVGGPRKSNDPLPPIPGKGSEHISNPLYESGTNLDSRIISNPNYNSRMQLPNSNENYSSIPGMKFNMTYRNPITYTKLELKKLKTELKPMRKTLKGNNRDSRLGNIVSNKRIVGMNNAQIYKFMSGLVGKKSGFLRSKKLSNSDKQVIRNKIISLRTKSNPLQLVAGLNNESESNSGYISVAGEEEV